VTETRIPLVSVVIPSYNHERYIGEAVESVLAQSISDFEIIVVDDGSSDDSVNVVKKFDDSRIKLFSQNNNGAHQALNNGVALASAPWIAILNSDDRFRSDKLEKHLALHARHPQFEASVSRVRYITESGASAKKDGYLAVRYGKYRRISTQHDSLFVSLLKVNHLITTSSLFLNREAFQLIGGFIPLRYVHDWFMFLTLAQRGHLHIIEEELTDYRRHSGNTIVENDERGRIEDNFVIEWQLFETLKSDEPLISMEDALCILSQNRRVNYELIFLFQIWRQLNRSNLKEAVRIFSEKDNALLNRALELLRKDKGLGDIVADFNRAVGYRWPSVADYFARAEQMFRRLVKNRGA
jgi:glycosyltransferase involved in cell wall biosynthesis